MNAGHFVLIMTDIFYKQNISAQAMLSDEERLTVVNVVASTRVAEELDLPDIAIQLNCEYEPEQFPGVVYRVVDPKLAILMFRSGRAVCTGGKNQQNIETGIERMIGDLRAAGISTWDVADVDIEVQNMVATYLSLIHI